MGKTWYLAILIVTIFFMGTSNSWSSERKDVFLFNRGHQNYLNRNYVEAITYYKKVIKMKSYLKYRAYFYMGLSYYKEGNEEKAYRIMKNLSRSPLRYSMMQKVHRMLKVIEQGQKESEFLDLAMESVRDKDYRQGLVYAAKAHRIRKSDESYFFIGLSYFHLGKIDKAQKFFARIRDPELAAQTESLKSEELDEVATLEEKESEDLFSGLVEVMYGSNSNPTAESLNENTNIASDISKSLDVNLSLDFIRGERWDGELSYSYYIEEFNENEEQNNSVQSLSLSLKKLFNETEIEVQPIYNIQASQNIAFLSQTGASLGISHDENQSRSFANVQLMKNKVENDDYFYLDGKQYNFSIGYIKFFNSFQLLLRGSYGVDQLNDTEFIAESKKSLGGQIRLSKYFGNFKLSTELRLEKTDYATVEATNFARQDKTRQINLRASYYMGDNWEVFMEHQRVTNRSNLMEENSDGNYQQTKSLIGISFSF